MHYIRKTLRNWRKGAVRQYTKMMREIKIRFHRLRLWRGQSTIEYALLVTIVTAAFIAMRVYVQRAVQANVKVIEEQINAEPQ